MKNEEYILNEELEIDHKMSFLAQPGTAEGFFYLTRPLLLGEAPTGKPAVLYSQTSSRPCGVARRVLRNKVAIVYAPKARLTHKEMGY